MPFRLCRLLLVTVAALSAAALSGCGTINEKLTEGMADYVPQWAGGVPAGAPPRPGSAKYDDYMRDLDRRRTEPAVKKEAAQKPAQPALDPVH